MLGIVPVQSNRIMQAVVLKVIYDFIQVLFFPSAHHGIILMVKLLQLYLFLVQAHMDQGKVLGKLLVRDAGNGAEKLCDCFLVFQCNRVLVHICPDDFFCDGHTESRAEYHSIIRSDDMDSAIFYVRGVTVEIGNIFHGRHFPVSGRFNRTDFPD